MNNMMLEIYNGEGKVVLIIETMSHVAPRVGEEVDIKDVEGSHDYGEVVVTNVSYKVTPFETEIWIKAVPKPD